MGRATHNRRQFLSSRVDFTIQLQVRNDFRPSQIYYDLMAFTALDSCTDELLMSHLAVAADREAFDRLFAEIFHRYKDRVGRWCYRVTKSEDRASDLAQEVFLRAFRSIHTFRGDSRVSTWLYVITRNHCLNDLRKGRSRTEEVSESSELCSRDDDAYALLERAEGAERMFSFLNSILNPTEVHVLSLHYVDELSLPAITRRLMLRNSSGAKAYLVSARRKLQRVSREEIEQRLAFERHLNPAVRDSRQAA